MTAIKSTPTPMFTLEEFDAYLSACASIEEAREDMNLENFTNVVNRVMKSKQEVNKEVKEPFISKEIEDAFSETLLDKRDAENSI